ncbi:HEAT repeat domain-containing protein [Eudoraea sp.]|uniref:HEAT repeat domain-containing protein n=1 Tax=Eudoraea sp. TaxID=1979955 RepID=UPI003C729E8D
MKIISQTYPSVMLIGAPKIHTDLLWDLTILFSGLGILFFVFVFISRNRISAKALKVSRQKKILTPIISNFLFYETDATKEENYEYIKLKIEIRDLLKTPFNRFVLTEILLDLKKDLSGDSRNRIFKLYQDLELHLDAFKKLRSWRWELVSKGILELTQMRVLAAYGFIKKFINDKRGVVRKQAQIATVTLKHEGISYFLDSTRYGISEWQQLKLLDVLRNFEDFTPPRFKAWLTSKNRDVVLFAIRLIKHYNQNDANKSLIELVKHRNDQIKSEAIQCIKDFGVFEAVPMLKSVFRNCSVDIKLQILDTISSLGKEEDIEFLQTIVNKESNFLVKSKAISTINVLVPETYVPTEGIDKNITTENFENNVEDNSTQLTEIMNNKEIQPEDSLSASNHEENSQDLQDHLDPEVEDEIIFDLCFMEELEDILTEFNESDKEVNYLPLDFLPLISEEEGLKFTLDPKTAENSDVETKEILEEESFKEELEAILDKIKTHNVDDMNEGEEDSELEFLPLVVEGSIADEPEDLVMAADEDILAIEVNEEEVVTEEKNSNLHNKIPQVDWLPEQELESFETIAKNSIDWMAFVSESERAGNMTQSAALNASTWHENIEGDENNDNSTPDFYGFSIFQELFRTCDTESKLILLDEILAVGDEKEVHFLKTLLEDSDKKVSAKAESILKELQKLLAPEMPDETTIEQIHTNGQGAENTYSDKEETEVTSPEIMKTASFPDIEEKNMKSLEYCFLDDASSENDNNHKHLFELDFELMDTALEVIKTGLQSDKTEKEENDKEEDIIFGSLMGNLILLPRKLKEMFNG